MTRTPIEPFRFGQKNTPRPQIGLQSLSGQSISNAVICTRRFWGVQAWQPLEKTPPPEVMPLVSVVTVVSLLVSGCTGDALPQGARQSNQG